jgi:hypothetical protein
LLPALEKGEQELKVGVDETAAQERMEKGIPSFLVEETPRFAETLFP